MNQAFTKVSFAIQREEEVTSTNDWLAEMCRDNANVPEYFTLFAHKQTAGKGQPGNTWESEPGKNITMSTLLYPSAIQARDQFVLSMIASLAVCKALARYTGGFSIKWPNDIYWHDKKIGGILIENELEGNYISQCIIGMGVNVNQEVFLSDAPNPVSLKQILGVEMQVMEVVNKILYGIASAYLELEHYDDMQALSKEYHSRLYRLGGKHLYRDAGGEFLAEILNVELDGHLNLLDEDGNRRRYAFKEVEFILPTDERQG